MPQPTQIMNQLAGKFSDKLYAINKELDQLTSKNADLQRAYQGRRDNIFKKVADILGKSLNTIFPGSMKTSEGVENQINENTSKINDLKQQANKVQQDYSDARKQAVQQIELDNNKHTAATPINRKE